MFKTNFLAIMILVLFHFSISSASEYIENSCKVKAKEIATLTYKNCVTEAKSKELEQIKKDYQKKLQALKSDYELKLKNLTDSKKQNSGTQNLNETSQTSDPQMIEMPLPTEDSQTY